MASTSSPHEYIPAKETDGRGPCPALNVLANHGYMYEINQAYRIQLTIFDGRPRDGKNISTTEFVSAITRIYNISYPLAYGLAIGGVALCGHGTRLDLEELRKHNAIEHDASIVSV